MMDSLKEANNNHQSNNNSSNNSPVMKSKGKRTKRQRIQQLALLKDHSLSTTTSSSSAESSSSTTEEEEDMANCLILLAQGHGLNTTPEPPSNEQNSSEKFSSRRYSETDGGLFIYECKTCNKCFSSFQALGGHRASHKKTKLAEENNPNVVGDLDGLQINANSLAKPGANNNSSSNKNRVHQCSICGAEFSSGQALGGHMRRHRPLNVSSEVKNEECRPIVLSLDLNLPAPDDDEGHLSPTMEFPVAAFETKQPLVFSVSALVDCHY